MILPIIFYENSILRKKCENIDFSYSKKEIIQLITNMFETVNKANGLGLSAPQIGKNIKIFILNIPYDNNKNYEETFINAKIIKIFGKEFEFNEGCLSIPGINVPINRKSNVIIEYYNRNFKKKKKFFDGIYARVILHEYDHLNGKLLTDYVKDKKLIKKKFNYNHE
ncbi:peptide deformylase [Blattabacterium cuenoti]|uniref:peptide deformylase n=1 Tax=Blattabacterium cuenoti TaxID=1653831 RepID=UPI00163BD268|nr:peptide deformylase [Blattabacterium cuenoti]